MNPWAPTNPDSSERLGQHWSSNQAEDSLFESENYQEQYHHHQISIEGVVDTRMSFAFQAMASSDMKSVPTSTRRQNAVAGVQLRDVLGLEAEAGCVVQG